MVWIHGGGFNGGTNFEYPGYFFAERDVVYVALNYRLGMLGKTKITVFKEKTESVDSLTQAMRSWRTAH